MKILVCTAIQKEANQRPFYFPRAIESILSLRHSGQLDHYMPSGGDDNPEQSITRKYQDARMLCLDGGYDALLLAESDMVLQPDTLERLTAVKADIAYGLYCVRHGSHEWTAMLELQTHKTVSISTQPEQARQSWGKVIEVAGVGHGCTLIHRRVLECFDFRSRPGFYPDWLFAIDAQYHGFKQCCDTGVICGHMTRENTILWPDPAAPGLCRIEEIA